METNNANKMHIAILGRVNSGKSSLINALVGQKVSIVSDVRGTTTDPVYKAMEIKGLGAVRLIDTAGTDDESELGTSRAAATKRAVESADAAILVIRREYGEPEEKIISYLKSKDIPYIAVLNKDGGNAVSPDFCKEIKENIIEVDAKGGENVSELIARLSELRPRRKKILDGVVKSGETAVLVMPQDGSAPTGRLILPQVTVIRELLDMGAAAVCCTPENLSETLKNLKKTDIVITDSQVFKEVAAVVPTSIRLTSFSVLLSKEKGDIDVFLSGAESMDKLTDKSRVLIAEACSHVPQNEDIGRVKIPRMLKMNYGVINIDFVNGNDFPDDLTEYDLIIHCGACMFNRKYLMNRVRAAEAAGVPMTNYGIAIAKLTGIIDRVVK